MTTNVRAIETAAFLDEQAWPDLAAWFVAQETARCDSCEGYGWVPDMTHPAARDGFPSLAPEIPCPACDGRGRVIGNGYR